MPPAQYKNIDVWNLSWVLWYEYMITTRLWVFPANYLFTWYLYDQCYQPFHTPPNLLNLKKPTFIPQNFKGSLIIHKFEFKILVFSLVITQGLYLKCMYGISEIFPALTLVSNVIWALVSSRSRYCLYESVYKYFTHMRTCD